MDSTHVLIIEDDSWHVRYLTDLLINSGFNTYSVNSSRKLSSGLSRLDRGGVDVVLLDLNLPDSEGLDTLYKVLASNDEVPVVIYTAVDDNRVALEAIKEGAEDYLTKGHVDGALLSRSIQSAIERKKSQRRLVEIQDDLKLQMEEQTMRLQQVNEELRIEIAERKLAEDKMRFQSERARMFLDITHVIIVQVNERAEIVLVNKKGCDVLGYSEEELLGKKIVDLLFPAEERELALNWFDRIMSGEIEGVQSLESIFTTPSGQQCIIRWTYSPIKNDRGFISGVLGSGEDVTEQKRLERWLIASSQIEAVNRLTSGIANDFNNIIATIIGYASHLKSRVRGDHYTCEEMQSIEDAAIRASELTAQLISFSTPEGITNRPVDINWIIRAVHESINGAVEKSHTVTLDLQQDMKSVEGDARQLRRMILHLLFNARDAMPDGGTITIKTAQRIVETEIDGSHMTIPPGEYCSIIITDEGEGMDSESIKKLFERSDTAFPGRDGTRLEMSTVYDIVMEHNGFIHVSSKPGMGTTISIYLHAIHRDEEDSSVEEEKEIGGTETILVIDNEPEFSWMLKGILGDYGYTMLIARSAGEGLEIYREKRDRIDVVMLDIIMPDIGGEAVLQDILKDNPDASILTMSGHTDELWHRELIKMGAADFIKKPFDVTTLLRKIRILASRERADK
ncbi:MAG: response regulator [Deltaproteobacteria bacterium]|nr:response regulator [Candidatus Zymogenaceae bacterium]